VVVAGPEGMGNRTSEVQGESTGKVSGGQNPPKLKQNVKLAYNSLTFFCTTFRI